VSDGVGQLGRRGAISLGSLGDANDDVGQLWVTKYERWRWAALRDAV
jgi:hypothetical protein